MSSSLPLHRIIDDLERRYPPSTAQDWDAVGLVVGEPDAQVSTVLFAIDPVQDVVDEAIDAGAQLIVAHHPLLLRGVTSVAADSAKGSIVHRLIRNGIALYVAHTNADAAAGGVNEALADLFDLRDRRPLQPLPGADLDLLVTYVPTEHAEPVRAALAGAGAGAVGDYSGCAWSVQGTGEFTPGGGADPAIGSIGEHTRVAETRLEMVLPAGTRGPVLAALRAAHPYEEPAFSVLSTIAEPGSTGSPSTGLGRIGQLPQPLPLNELAELVARVLPATAHGVRVAGDPESIVRTLAVCGGSGDSLLQTAERAGADAYLTADLRHHPASEARAVPGAPALLDVAHWASEWPWLPVAARALQADAQAAGAALQVQVSAHPTDPWTARVEASDRKGFA